MTKLYEINSVSVLFILRTKKCLHIGVPSSKDGCSAAARSTIAPRLERDVLAPPSSSSTLLFYSFPCSLISSEYACPRRPLAPPPSLPLYPPSLLPLSSLSTPSLIPLSFLFPPSSLDICRGCYARPTAPFRLYCRSLALAQVRAPGGAQPLSLLSLTEKNKTMNHCNT